MVPALPRGEHHARLFFLFLVLVVFCVLRFGDVMDGRGRSVWRCGCERRVGGSRCRSRGGRQRAKLELERRLELELGGRLVRRRRGRRMVRPFPALPGYIIWNGSSVTFRPSIMTTTRYGPGGQRSVSPDENAA